MTAKRYLQRFRELAWQIDAMDAQVARMKTEYNPLPSPRLDADRVQTSPTVHCDADEWIALQQDILRKKLDLERLKADIIEEIGALHDLRLQRILGMRYLDGQSLESIAYHTGYTYDYARELHGIALKRFGELHRDKIDSVLD